MSQPARAVAYLRRSSLKQKDSLERQEGAILPFAAARGIDVVATYRDSRPGDEFHKRPGLQQLLADAKAGKFKTILIDEPSRLSRQDIVEFFADIVSPLKKADIEVVSVKFGTHDWNSLPGLILTVVEKYADRGELIKLACRSADGMVEAIREHKWLGGPIPYGYRLSLDLHGHKCLIIDPEQGEIVRLIFSWYGDEGCSLSVISERLAGRRIPPPKWREGRKSAVWSKPTLANLMRNTCYTGSRFWNKRHMGKYSAVVNGEAIPRAARPGRNPRGEWLPSGECPALVGQDLFDRVQRRLAENQRLTTPTRDHDFLLAGLLACGQCRHNMAGRHYHGKKYYLCGQYSRCGKHACQGATAAEEEILAGTLDTLRGAYLSDENLRRLRRLASDMDREHRTKSPAEVGRLEHRVAELNVQIDGALAKWASLPAGLGAELVARMAAWKEERSQAEERLAVLRSRPERQELAGKVEALEALRARLDEALGEPALLGAWLRAAIRKVTLWYEPKGPGKRAGRAGRRRRQYALVRAKVTARADPDLDLNFCLSSKGSRALQVENIWTLDIA